MAREYSFKANMNFEFANHAELTSMRSAAASFAAARSGNYFIITRENNDHGTYYGRLELTLPVTSRSNAATLMGLIDGQLSSLPDLVAENGSKLIYSFEEREV